jgi:hypothetical protein
MSFYKEGASLEGLTGKGKKSMEMCLVLVFKGEEVGTYSARRDIAKVELFRECQ